MDDLAGAHIRVPDHVVFRAFESETVLLNLETGAYHGLNATGGRILELLRDSGSAAVAAQALADEYHQPLERTAHDVTELCSALAERGLIEVGEPPG